MSIFGKIKQAIFGDTPPWERDILGRAPRQAPTAQAPKTPDQPAMPQMQVPTAAPNTTTQPPVDVDVTKVLEGIAASKGSPNLNWRESIVDLLKLLDIDSSLEARKELAQELGYTRPKDGSAEMNIWLHKQVMLQLQTNGGKVPASLRD